MLVASVAVPLRADPGKPETQSVSTAAGTSQGVCHRAGRRGHGVSKVFLLLWRSFKFQRFLQIGRDQSQCSPWRCQRQGVEIEVSP